MTAGNPAVTSDRPAQNRTGSSPTPVQGGRKHRALRKFQIAYLDRQDQPNWTEQIGPASPIFESAFSAFAQGVHIATPGGPVAVQDLVPGMSVMTETRGPMKLLWIGSMTLVPKALGVDPSSCRMTRVMPDTFGLGKPESNLMAGPGARMLARPRGFDQGMGRERMLIPALGLVDGMNIIEVAPPRPVTVYHLALRRHAIIRASGVEMESFHPGAGFERNMGHNMLTLFMSLFPHVSAPADFGDTICPRLDLAMI